MSPVDLTSIWSRLVGAASLAVLAALAGCAPPPGPAAKLAAPVAPVFRSRAESAAVLDARFAAFLRDFRNVAIAAGIRPATYDRSMAGLHRSPRVEQLNLDQPEFVKPVWAYLDGAVSPERVARGREMLAANVTTLAKIEARFSVPKEILVAIWGEESGYGAAMGGFNLFEALATLAYDGPRKEFARRELIAAMKMEEQEHLSPRAMTSSWAGAFGQTQFVPSSFLANAMDGDGDGRRDLWHSAPDSLASTAKLMHDAGWRLGEPCLAEIALPKDFPYELADADATRPLVEWERLGMRPVEGGHLPAMASDGAIYLPAGARGPAFLVFRNFKVVLTYNNAASYALAICNLADRLRGGGMIVARWPRDEQPLTQEDRFALQTDLRTLGYEAGDIDGVLGRQVRASLRKYQKDRRLPADGFPTKELLRRMQAEIAARRGSS